MGVGVQEHWEGHRLPTICPKDSQWLLSIDCVNAGQFASIADPSFCEVKLQIGEFGTPNHQHTQPSSLVPEPPAALLDGGPSIIPYNPKACLIAAEDGQARSSPAACR